MNHRQRHADRDAAARVGESLFHFRRGMLAGQSGRPRLSNPHAPASGSGYAWDRGWKYGAVLRAEAGLDG